MARTRDLWYKTVTGPDDKPVKVQTARYGHGKRWLAVWAGPDGHEATRAFAKKSDADRYGSAQETDAARGTYIDPRLARTTVEQWCDELARRVRARGGRRTVRQARDARQADHRGVRADAARRRPAVARQGLDLAAAR